MKILPWVAPRLLQWITSTEAGGSFHGSLFASVDVDGIHGHGDFYGSKLTSI